MAGRTGAAERRKEHWQDSWRTATDDCDSLAVAMDTVDSIPDDIGALRAELAAERAARREAEAQTDGVEAIVAHLKLVIAKLAHHRYGTSSGIRPP